MNSTHTPAPWESDDTQQYYEGHVIRKNGMIVCRMLDLGFPSHGDRIANARLIAKAPEMRDLLHKFAMGDMKLPHTEYEMNLRAQARALLAELDGQPSPRPEQSHMNSTTYTMRCALRIGHQLPHLMVKSTSLVALLGECTATAEVPDDTVPRQCPKCGCDLRQCVCHASGEKWLERMSDTITAYSLAWLSRSMPAPAFWYYRTEPAALAAAERLRPECKTKIREVQVPMDFDRWAE